LKTPTALWIFQKRLLIGQEDLDLMQNLFLEL